MQPTTGGQRHLHHTKQHAPNSTGTNVVKGTHLQHLCSSKLRLSLQDAFCTSPHQSTSPVAPRSHEHHRCVHRRMTAVGRTQSAADGAVRHLNCRLVAQGYRYRCHASIVFAWHCMTLSSHAPVRSTLVRPCKDSPPAMHKGPQSAHCPHTVTTLLLSPKARYCTRNSDP